MQPKKTACIPEVRKERVATSSASITVSHPLAIKALPSDSLNEALIGTMLEGGKTTSSFKIRVFRDVTPCSLVHRRLGSAASCCLHLQGRILRHQAQESAVLNYFVA
jgi:hypothetical protein